MTKLTVTGGQTVIKRLTKVCGKVAIRPTLAVQLVIGVRKRRTIGAPMSNSRVGAPLARSKIRPPVTASRARGVLTQSKLTAPLTQSKVSMSVYESKIGSDHPDIPDFLLDQDGNPALEVGSTVEIRWRQVGEGFGVWMAATVTDQPTAEVAYDIQPGDFTIAADYEAEWRETTSGGALRIYPSAGYRLLKFNE